MQKSIWWILDYKASYRYKATESILKSDKFR